MQEAQELTSPRISFSHDLMTAVETPPPPPAVTSHRSDTSLASRLPEPEFDFANANATAADDVAPAGLLFAGGKLLPVPPLPPAPKSNLCIKQQETTSNRAKGQQACQQKRPGSWASPFSRSSSVNSATTATGARRSGGRFGCPPFPLMRSRSDGTAAAMARDGGLGSVISDTGRRLQCYKKVGATAAAGNGGSSRVYYYGGSRKGSSHGVRISPVLNVTFIGTSVVNALSYLLCDCSGKTTKGRGFQS